MQVTEKMLLERVQDAIGAYDGSGRAAILEVAAWIQENSISVTGQVWAAQLEMEANRGLTTSPAELTGDKRTKHVLSVQRFEFLPRTTPTEEPAFGPHSSHYGQCFWLLPFSLTTPYTPAIRQTMTDSITPPPELVQQWIKQGVGRPPSTDYMTHFANCAAQWGADQELEACCEWLWRDLDAYELVASRAVYLDHNLRASRRPKPSSLKEQALHELADVYDRDKIDDTTCDTIRRALEALDD